MAVLLSATRYYKSQSLQFLFKLMCCSYIPKVSILCFSNDASYNDTHGQTCIYVRLRLLYPDF